MMETLSNVRAFHLMIGSIVLWIGLRWVIRPYVVRRFRDHGGPRSLGTYVRLNLVELAVSASAVLALSFALALAIYFVATSHGGTVADLDRAVIRVRGLRQFFAWLGGAWSVAGLGLLLVGLAILTMRRARTRWHDVQRRRIEE
jgi:hypothetical protein